MAWQRRYSGTASARVTVDPDGHVPPDGVQITSSTNPSMYQVFAGVLSTCLFVPGRIAGVAVWTIVATKTGIGNVGGLP